MTAANSDSETVGSGNIPVRVPPLAPDEWAPGLLERCHEIVGEGLRADANVYSTVAHHGPLLEAWLGLGSHLLRRSSLHPRDRELVILRTTAVAQGSYPFVQHCRIGAGVGLDDDEIAAILVGRIDRRWASIDRVMLAAVDELMVHGSVSPGVWAELVDNGSVAQALDLIATVAFYRLASWMLNSAGTPLDESPPSPRTQTEVIEQLQTVEAQPLSDKPRSSPGVLLLPRPLEEWPADLLDETTTWPRFADFPERRRAGVYCTLANNPELFVSIGPLMAHFLTAITLSDAQRELVIVRSCLRDRGEYPYRQHVNIGETAGLSPALLAALGLPDPRSSDHVNAGSVEHALISIVDDIHDLNRVSDQTWKQATGLLTTEQIFDTIALSGFYGVVSFVLSSAGTVLEEGDIFLPEDIPTKAHQVEKPVTPQ